jgi:hypothetical protein
VSEVQERAGHFATQLFEALHGGAWERAAALFDPSELAAFQRFQLEEFLGHFRDATKEGEDLARYIADPFLLLPQIAARPVIGWPALGTVQHLVDLSPTVFFARYLEVAQEAFGDIAVPRSVAAVATEGSGLLHVLYRRDQDAVERAHRRFVRFYGKAPSWAVSVLSIRNTDQSLAALPNYELNGELLSKILFFLDRDSKPPDP